MLTRRQFALGAPLALAACGAQEVWAPDAFVQDRRYVQSGAPSVSLFTIRNVGTERGAHSSIMVNGDQRVIFDPAGSFRHEKMPERNDVIYGITPRALEVYINYHTRRTYFTVELASEIDLSVANDLIRRMEAYGPVPRAFCTRSISTILSETQEFSDIRTVWFPEFLEEQFARRPGLTRRVYTDDDAHDNRMVLQEFIP